MVTRIRTSAAKGSAGTGALASVRSLPALAGKVLLPGGERMSRVDTAWLRMDSPRNLMMIVGVWILRPGVRYEDLCQRVEERLLTYQRFTQRVVQDAAGALWVPDKAFDIHHHVVREALPRHAKGKAREALQNRLGQLAMQPLDPRRPLWQFHLVEDYDGGSALLARIHHCIADGIALIAVMQSLVDGGVAPPTRRARQAPREGWGAAEDWIAGSLVKPLAGAAVRLLDGAGSGAAGVLGLLGQPQAGVEKGLGASMDTARMAYQVLRDAASLALMPDDSASRLKGLPGQRKAVAWGEPLPLDEVKAVGKALGCSVNDVLLSCVAGAIASYLRAHGDALQGREIRAMVPVNLRPLEQAHKLGNRFGLVPVLLPLGLPNPVQRVYEVRRRMRELKGSTQPLMTFGLLALAGLLVKPAQDAMLELFSSKTTAVMTNVPGPSTKMRFLGATLEQTLFWVPQSGNVGLGVSILTYGGGVQFGLVADTGLCPEPQRIIDGFAPEFEQLKLLALMLPWGG